MHISRSRAHSTPRAAPGHSLRVRSASACHGAVSAPPSSKPGPAPVLPFRHGALRFHPGRSRTRSPTHGAWPPRTDLARQPQTRFFGFFRCPGIFPRYNRAMDYPLPLIGPAAFAEAFQGYDLAQKAKAFSLMEESIAFERACSSMQLLADCFGSHLWVKELAFRWRSGFSFVSASFKISPGVAEGDSALSQNGCTLSSIIDFSILSALLAQGSLTEADATKARGMPESMKPAFLLGSRGEGFSAKAAIDVKAKLILAETELGKALGWSHSSNASWMQSAAPQGLNWERKIVRGQISSPRDVAFSMGFEVLAAEIEKRELSTATPNPSSAPARRPL